MPKGTRHTVPAFAILDHEPGKLLVEYRSNRTGLEPFVAGLLEGLLERFDLVGEVTEVAGGNAVRFEVAFRGGDCIFVSGIHCSRSRRRDHCDRPGDRSAVQEFPDR